MGDRRSWIDRDQPAVRLAATCPSCQRHVYLCYAVDRNPELAVETDAAGLAVVRCVGCGNIPERCPCAVA